MQEERGDFYERDGRKKTKVDRIARVENT